MTIWPPEGDGDGDGEGEGDGEGAGAGGALEEAAFSLAPPPQPLAAMTPATSMAVRICMIMVLVDTPVVDEGN